MLCNSTELSSFLVPCYRLPAINFPNIKKKKECSLPYSQMPSDNPYPGLDKSTQSHHPYPISLKSA
jgi:hypothetical protein